MSIEYRITETERENLLDGDYVAVIKKVEEKMDKYGSYFEVEEELLSPVDVEGRREFERFYTGAYDEDKKRKSEWAFSKLCKQLLPLKTGEILKIEHLVGKHFIKTVKNNIGTSGRAYQNTVSRILIEDLLSIPQREDKRPSPPQETAKSDWPIDDEVPF
jgi:hypothetical protein